jgi:hypothetical protein
MGTILIMRSIDPENDGGGAIGEKDQVIGCDCLRPIQVNLAGLDNITPIRGAGKYDLGDQVRGDDNTPGPGMGTAPIFICRGGREKRNRLGE